MAWLVGHHVRVNQPQDSPGTPDQESGEAAGQSAPSSGGFEQSPPGYGTAVPATAGYGAPSQTPSGYGTPVPAPPGYGTPASQAYPSYPQPGYGTPGQAPSGYGAPGQPPSGYGTPGGQAYPSYPQPGYGTPGQPPPGYGTPASQSYPSYPQPGYGTPGQAPSGYGTAPGQAYPYPQPGYWQPYQPGYGQYQGYGQPYRAFEPVNGRKNPALAEWWRRLLARLIDGFILGVIFSPLWIPPWRAFFTTVNNLEIEYGTEISTNPAAKSAVATAESHLIVKMFVIALGFYLVAFLYDWIQHWHWGQTIGKRALGTRVVRDDGNPNVGAGAACGRAAIYAFAPLIPLVGSLFELLNELWLTWDPRRQCLHDKAAHTVVVKKDYQGPQPQPGGWQPGSW
jgi:uncharacterized RDD family membrane protein YckC